MNKEEIKEYDNQQLKKLLIKLNDINNFTGFKDGSFRYEMTKYEADILKEYIEELKDRIDKANWWLEEMLKQAKNDETKAIICGALELLLKEIRNDI